LFDFERRQIVGAHIAGASMTKTTTSLGVLRVTVCKVVLAYTNHGKTSAKRNGGQKSALAERDHHTLRRINAKIHTAAVAQVTAELDIHLEESVST
jgi:transposase